MRNFIFDVIKERLPDVQIHKLLSGAVIFETETSYDKLNFFCFNNVFAVISIMEHKDSYNALEKHIRSICHLSENLNLLSNNSKNIRSFRIVISNENKPAAINEKLRTEAEKTISRLSGLKPNRSLPDTEFWFLYRSEKFSCFMKRLTLRSSWEKTLHKGELPPPLAWTLCRLAGLTYTDTVMDPFCGYGSIPQAALKHFHITKFIACDNNQQAVNFSSARFNKRKKGEITVRKIDFNDLPSLIEEKSVNAIVTDPPWGNFKEIHDRHFHKKMFDVSFKLLQDGGRLVMLYNDDDLLKDAAGFSVDNRIPVLLSGRKAVILVLTKKRLCG